VNRAWVLQKNAASFAHIRPFLHMHKGRFFEIFLCGLLVNLFGLALPLFSSFVYDKILGNNIMETLWALVMGLGLIVIIEFCVKCLRTMVAERFAISSEADIDHSVFQNLLDTKTNELPPIGSLIEKYKQILNCRDLLSSSYLLSLVDLPFLLIFLAAITAVSGPLVLVAVVCGTIMVTTSFITSLSVLEYDKQARKAGEQRFGLLTDLLTARDAVIGSSLRDSLLQRWRQSSLASTQASSMARYWRAMGGTISSSVSYISYIAVLVGGAYMVQDQTLTAGGLLAASLLTSRTIANFGSVMNLIVRFREFQNALKELNQIFPAQPAQKPLAAYGQLQGGIKLEKVECRLKAGARPVLSGVSLNIQPGEMIGIAGAPGGGKTTLLRLIAGTLKPNEGVVMIDNIPLNKISPEDISINMGVKPQDFCLFDGTIEDNILAGRAPLSAEMRQNILQASGLFRSFQEGGLNWATDVGPRGSNLSGGQRQLVSIARAMLYDPPVLLLDEPTNGLDAALEAHLVQQLLQRKGRCTMLISTHSRQLLSACDRIVVVGQARILADGPREKILAS
jgi:ATP-binding cassette subfamily B protein/ATP-binding cassette subfamily C protein LapB